MFGRNLIRCYLIRSVLSVDHNFINIPALIFSAERGIRTSAPFAGEQKARELKWRTHTKVLALIQVETMVGLILDPRVYIFGIGRVCHLASSLHS